VVGGLLWRGSEKSSIKKLAKIHKPAKLTTWTKLVNTTSSKMRMAVWSVITSKKKLVTAADALGQKEADAPNQAAASSAALVATTTAAAQTIPFRRDARNRFAAGILTTFKYPMAGRFLFANSATAKLYAHSGG
jgi:hypothetical protein